jgi:hypothetical protein
MQKVNGMEKMFANHVSDKGLMTQNAMMNNPPFFPFLFCIAEDQTWDLSPARQRLYHWATSYH